MYTTLQTLLILELRMIYFPYTSFSKFAIEIVYFVIYPALIKIER